MQRALSWADVSVEQIARELEVSRSTVSGWLNDRHAPRAIYVREWAKRCKVPLDWLIEGDSGLPRVDSNHQPADMENDPHPFGAAEKLAMRKMLPIRLGEGSPVQSVAL